MQKIVWRCQCGRTGTMRKPVNASLAGLVRAARNDHERKHGHLCKDPDIEAVDTPEELVQRQRREWERLHPLGEGFC